MRRLDLVKNLNKKFHGGQDAQAKRVGFNKLYLNTKSK